ncbi:MAG: TonB-dependent receptor [Methylococcaceae bacterium]|nr:TonB-dependent receptor [Methylococcaceae bacterium]
MTTLRNLRFTTVLCLARPTFSRRNLALATTLAACMPAMSIGAEAEAPIPFDIPAQDLTRALSAFTAQSHVQVLYEGEITQGLRSAPLKGSYSPEKALKALLTAIPVQARFTGRRTATLERGGKSLPLESNSGDAIALGKVTVRASADKGELDPYNKIYSVPNSSAATKTDTPLIETPVSVQVIPYQVLQDQKSYRLQDALENVSGVRPNKTLGFRERYIIRGFKGGENFYRNGLRVASSGYSQSFETADIDRIEVMKGPASVLYGRGEPSGAIGFITKRPLDGKFYSIEQNFGSYDYYRTNLDIGSPLTEDGSLAYRISGAYTNTASFRDFASLDGLVIYPTLRWRPTNSTEINLGLEVIYQDFHADFGIPAVGKRPASIPISRSLQDPNDPKDNQNTINLDYSLRHKFNENWAITNRFLTSHQHANNNDISPSALRSDGKTLDRNISNQDYDLEKYTTNVDLTGKFHTGFAKHEVLAGIDYYRDSSTYFWDPVQFNNVDPSYAIDITNPRYYGINPSRFYVRPGAINPQSKAQEEWYGVYFQDQITLWEKLHILAGGRQDWVDRSNHNFIRGLTKQTHEESFSPRAGVLYEVQPWLSVYGNWSRSFGVNNGLDKAGNPLSPEKGEAYEGGLKGLWLDGRLTGTLAFYHIVKSNILTPDYTTKDPNDYATIGEARSRGIEFDMSGRLTENLDLIASYAYTDARVTKDGDGNKGKRLQGAPEHSGRVWLKYEFPENSGLGGFSFGGGPYLVGSRAGDTPNSYMLPGFVRLDAFLGYRLKVGKTPLLAQVNIRNLLDKRYYDSSDQGANADPRVSIYPGEPLTVIGSLKVEY